MPHEDFKLTVKDDGNLSRTEIETYIEKECFNDLKELIAKPLITKVYKKYKLMNDLILECSIVDKGLPLEFMYAEIEFHSEDEACRFIPPDYLGIEVTYDEAYKMKNYWVKTRLS